VQLRGQRACERETEKQSPNDIPIGFDHDTPENILDIEKRRRTKASVIVSTRSAIARIFYLLAFSTG
jgi:hypothetical protein